MTEHRWAGAARKGMVAASLSRLHEEDVLLEEQGNLWADLETARHDALNGMWSVQCDWFVQRIAWLAVFTGKATPWQEVQVGLLLDGTYQGILTLAGVPYEPPDMDRVRAVDAMIKEGARR